MTSSFLNKLEFKKIHGYNIVHYPTKKDICLLTVIIRSGFLYENAQEAGCGHLLEHCLLEAWKEHPQMGLNITISNTGASYNASTSTDYIEFHIQFDVKYLTSNFYNNFGIFQYFMQSILTPALTEERLAIEKNAVEQELLIYKSDNFYAKKLEMCKRLFPRSGIEYNCDIDHLLNILETITIPDLYAYHKKFFTKKNIIISILSKSITAPMKKCLKEIRIPEGQRFEPPFSLHVPREHIIHIDVPELEKTFVDIVYYCPYKETQIEQLRIQFLLNMLTSGMGSVLTNKLREENKMIYSIKSSSETFNEFSLLYFSFSIDDQYIVNSINIIKEQLNNMKELQQHDYLKKHFKAEKNSFKVAQLDMCDTHMEQISYYTELYFYHHKKNNLKAFTKKQINKYIKTFTMKDASELCTHIFDFCSIFISKSLS